MGALCVNALVAVSLQPSCALTLLCIVIFVLVTPALCIVCHIAMLLYNYVVCCVIVHCIHVDCMTMYPSSAYCELVFRDFMFELHNSYLHSCDTFIFLALSVFVPSSYIATIYSLPICCNIFYISPSLLRSWCARVCLCDPCIPSISL